MKGARAGQAAPDWENPAIFGINKRASHAPLRSYRDLQASVIALKPTVAPSEVHLPKCTSALPAPATKSHPPDAWRDNLPSIIGGNWGIRRLSGCDWEFRLFGNPGLVPEDFPQPGFDTTGWGKVRA